MSEWYYHAAGLSNAEYALDDVRRFHWAVLRAYEGMRKSLYCTRVILPEFLGGIFLPPKYSVWCCYTSDNLPPRLVCQDREMWLRIINKDLIGVHHRHGGGWFSRKLIYSFVFGLGDSDSIPESSYICKCALGKKCGGRKADERYLMYLDLRKNSEIYKTTSEENESLEEDAEESEKPSYEITKELEDDWRDIEYAF